MKQRYVLDCNWAMGGADLNKNHT